MMWSDLLIASPDEIIAWAGHESWVKSMSKCLQDSGWHAEGDVWTHTKLVCEQLRALSKWNDLDDRQRRILFFTGLLHDIAKPTTTQIDPETGRTRSPKHAVKGEFVARDILRQLNCPLDEREEIARMVRYHGRPVFILDKPDPIHEAVGLSWLVNNQLLYLFALSDNRGRQNKDGNRPEDNIELWRMVCEENNCFQRSYPFANDHARFMFYRKPDLHYIPYEKYSCTVIMLSGLPGAGKDTWAKKCDLPMVSLDLIRDEIDVDSSDDQGQVIQEAQKQCREHLRNKQSFIFNATNLLKQTRQRWINLFVDYGAKISIIYIEPPMSKILFQNKHREDSVPERVIVKLAAKMEPPTWGEAHSLTYVG